MYLIMAQQGGMMGQGGGQMMGMHWGWWLFWLLVLVVLVWAVVQMTGGSTGGGSGTGAPPTTRSPEDVLRERFARGEISEEDFRRRLRLLEESGKQAR